MGLDLSRIEAFTRDMLEAEARRRRIRNPEFRTHGELVRLLLRHQYGDRFSAGRERFARGIRTFEQARELFGMAVGAALSALPEPLGAIGRTPPPPVTDDDEPRAAGHEIVPPAREALDADTYIKTPLPPRDLTQEPEPEPVRQAHGAHAVSMPPRSHEIVPPPLQLLDARSHPPSAAPIGVTHTFTEEPIRTRTMARVLCAQGHRERALLIYEELLAQNSEDTALVAEADAVRRGEALDPKLLPDPEYAPERWPVPDTGDQLSCAGSVDDGLLLRWHVTSDGQRRARAVLGSQGELALRVVSIGPDPERVVRSEITEHGPVPEAGEWNAPSLARGTRCFAAVGVREGARFVAIAHAHP